MGEGARRAVCDSRVLQGQSQERALKGGGTRLSALRKRSPQPYLHSPSVYFDAHCDHSLPRDKVLSETTQRTRWAPSAFESHCRARAARCRPTRSAL